MKPRLVDLSQFLKETKSIEYERKSIQNKSGFHKNKDLNIRSILNMSAVIIILLGLFFLRKRKENKEEKRNELEQKLDKLREIIENN